MMEKRINAGKPVDDFIRIQDLWGIFVPKWYWFAISLFITLVCASLYLLSTPNIYTRTAAVLIKDDSKNGSSTSAMNEFADMGLFKSNTNINNELLTMKSPTLMTEVVRRLVLNETYIIRRGLKQIELYKNSPVWVTYLANGEFYQFNLSSCIRQQNSLTAQFVSFSLSNLANIFYPPQFLQ